MRRPLQPLVWLALGLRLWGGTSPSVILISVDTLRADRLSCYGYRGQRTPNIDAIAQGGTLFSQVSSPVPLTLPAHVSLLTSTYPFANGVKDNGEQLGPAAITLATVFKGRGYRTAAFVGGFVLDRRFGLARGFDVYDSPFQVHTVAGVDTGDIKRPAEEVVRAAMRWLEAPSTRPYFLFLHLYDLHTPYDPPPAWRARSGGGYAAEIGYVDESLGRFWKFLAQRRLLDQALVVFTSDHGEGLGDHGESTHGYFIYQSTLRVPLIFHWPAGGRRLASEVSEPVSLVNVAPTILEFAGVPAPRQMQGRSQFSTARPDEGVYSESRYANTHFGCAVLRSLRAGRYKYVEAPRPELYDLSRDPGESRNLYATTRALADSYRSRLRAFGARFPRTSSTPAAMVSPETMVALRSLGYLAGGGSAGSFSGGGADPKDHIADFETSGRAIALASAGRIAEANKLLESLLDRLPAAADLRMNLGLNEQRLGQHLEAARNFRLILKRDPQNAIALFNLAVSSYALRQYDESIRALQITLRLRPYYTRAEELLGTIRFERKEWKGARESFEHILTVAPEDYAAHFNLGVLCTLEGKWEEGERHLWLALKANPRSAEAQNAVGSLYLRRGNLDRAESAFAEAIRLDPHFAWAHYNLGLILRRRNRIPDAAREFRAALAADPQFGAARTAVERLAGQEQ